MARIAWYGELGESKYKGISAYKVSSEIDELIDKNGGQVTPRQIVDRAKDESAELHKCFTWDDAQAADKWRLQEARQLRYFLVVKDDEKPNAPEVKILHFTGNGQGYKKADVVFRVKEEYDALLSRACAELKFFQKKYYSLKNELPEIFELIDQLP